MGRKSKFTFEQKLKVCIDYLSGRESSAEIATRIGLGHNGRKTILSWSEKYKKYGEEGLLEKKHNNRYTKEFKEQVVLEYINKGTSFNELALKHNIPDKSTIIKWFRTYNSHIELKDYNLRPKVYMAKRKKTTREERLEAVQYCISHSTNYAETAALYGCSYNQIYSWVQKYRENGEEALADKRGIKKTEEEIPETERLKRRIKELENQLRLKELENEILKKVEEFERKW